METTSKSAVKKLSPESVKLLNKIKDKANQKDFGRKVKDSEVIHMGLSLIDNSKIKELQDATLSEQDRLKVAHQEHCKAHGNISLDAFIGLLLRREARG